MIFHARAFVGGGSDSFSYEEISSVQGQRGFILGSIQFNVKGKTEKFDNMQKDEVDKSVEIIRERIKKVEKDDKKTQGTTLDPIEKLKKLKELLDLGAITKEEFEKKKKELLDSI